MTTVVRIGGHTAKHKPVKPGQRPIPQVRRDHPAVNCLVQAADILRLRTTWTDEKRLAEARALLQEAEQEVFHNLPTGWWYGAFRLQYKDRMPDGTLRYLVTCVCGKDHYLTTEELTRYMVEHTGCRDDCCQQKLLMRLFWGTLPDALRVQWKLMQACYPDGIPSYWGGTLDNLFDRDFKTGFVRAYQEVLCHLVDLSRPDLRWLTPLNPELPYTLDNLTLAKEPWNRLDRLNMLKPVIAGAPVRMSELCSGLNVTPEQVLAALVDDNVDPDELVVALLGFGEAR